MATAVITSKGQITIPKEVRERLNVDAGDRVEFVEVDKRVFAIMPATRDIRDLKGSSSFGVKKRGSLAIDYQMPFEGGAITRW